MNVERAMSLDHSGIRSLEVIYATHLPLLCGKAQDARTITALADGLLACRRMPKVHVSDATERSTARSSPIGRTLDSGWKCGSMRRRSMRRVISRSSEDCSAVRW
jgi:hypothetical protein